jgi:predicted phosphate transport protein (TIGR00153 family)
MRLAVVPRPTQFYGLFADAGANALEAARLTEARVADFPETEIDQAQVKELESEGDRLTREIIQLLNTQYVTPFDREDIYDLARAVDDVVDHIEHASDLLTLYRIEGPMEQARAQCRVLVGATESLSSALARLRTPATAQEFLAQVKRYEDDGDRIVRDAIASLFEEEDVSPLVVIRWKDIFEALEQAIDACETASHVIGNIIVKNA